MSSGDSDTASYGCEGPYSGPDDVINMDPAKENCWNGYAAQAARCLEADYSLVAWTGIGVCGAPPIPGTALDIQLGGSRTLYGRALGNTRHDVPW